MGLKEELQKFVKEHPESIEEEKEGVTFEEFKALVRDKVLEDRVLKQMRLTWHEDAHTMMIFQGVRTNRLATLRSNGVHTISRSVIKKRIQDILDLDIIN